MPLNAHKRENYPQLGIVQSREFRNSKEIHRIITPAAPSNSFSKDNEKSRPQPQKKEKSSIIDSGDENRTFMHKKDCFRSHFSSLGAIHSPKIFGNFGLKLNGSVRSNRKSFEKSVRLSRWTSFLGWTVPFDHSDPFSIPGPRCSVSSVYNIYHKSLPASQLKVYVLAVDDS